MDALKLSDSGHEAVHRLKKSASEVTVSANALGHVISQARKELQEEFRRQLDAAEVQWRTDVNQDFHRQLDAAQNEWKMQMEAERINNAEQVQALRQTVSDMASATAAMRADLQRLQAEAASGVRCVTTDLGSAQLAGPWRPQVGCTAEAKFGRDVLECTILEVGESIVKVRWAFDGSEDEVVKSKVFEKAPRRTGQVVPVQVDRSGQRAEPPAQGTAAVLAQAKPPPMCVMVQAPAQAQEVPTDPLAHAVSGVMTPLFFMPRLQQHTGAQHNGTQLNGTQPPAAPSMVPPLPVATVQMSPRMASCPAAPLAAAGDSARPGTPAGILGMRKVPSISSITASPSVGARVSPRRMVTSPPPTSPKRIRAVPSQPLLHATQATSGSWVAPPLPPSGVAGAPSGATSGGSWVAPPLLPELLPSGVAGAPSGATSGGSWVAPGVAGAQATSA